MKTIPTLFPFTPKTLLAGLSLLCAAPVSAAIVANFDAGVTTGAVDGYVGQAGSGWLTAWSKASQALDQDNMAVTVLDTDPLQPGSGNYLSANYFQDRDGTRSGWVVRQIDQGVALGLQDTYVLDFLLRIDTDLAELGHFFFTASVKSNPLLQRAVSDQSAWGLATFPLSSSAPTLHFVDGVDGSGNTAYDDTGVTVFQGDVFQLSFTVNPTLEQYSAGVTNLSHAAESRSGPASYTSGVLDFAYKPTAGETADFLNFLVRGTQNKNMGFSLDSISIAPIPEPAWAGLIIGLAALAVGLHRRRR